MTAAMKGSATAPMTVARGGGGKEGATFSINTSAFSSKNAFAGIEARYGKAMNLGSTSPLGREIRIGAQRTPLSPVRTQFSNPDRVHAMKGIHIDTPYTGQVLAPKAQRSSEKSSEHILGETVPLRVDHPAVTDKTVRKNEALDLLKGKNAITLFERHNTEKRVEQPAIKKDATVPPVLAEPRTPPSEPERTIRPVISQRESAPQPTPAPLDVRVKPQELPTKVSSNLSEIGLTIAKAETLRKPTAISEQPKSPEMPQVPSAKAEEIKAQESSLQVVRQALQEIEPVTQTTQPELIIPSPVMDHRLVNAPQLDGKPKKDARTNSPVGIVQEKESKRYPSVGKPEENPTKKDEIEKVVKSVETPKLADKDEEKKLLMTYVSQFILVNYVKDSPSKEQQARNVLIASKMAEYMTNPAHMDNGDQLETQLFGDANTLSEAVAMKKIEELVRETRVKIQLASFQDIDKEKVEKKAFMLLHMKIQEAGLVAIFTKVQTTVMEDLMADGMQLPEITDGKDDDVETEEQENTIIENEEKEEEKKDKQPVLVELDTFADKFRRWYMKYKAQRAFEKAEEKGKKMVTTGEIAREIGTYQFQFTKSRPVRWTNHPDGSITETLQELQQENSTVDSVETAEQIVNDKIDKFAPVQPTLKVKTQRRGIIDLWRVLGVYDSEQNFSKSA